MKYRIVVLTAILFTACNLLHAQVQTGKLSGVIIDANNEETLVGANIYVESLKKGTSTDKNGEFSIEVLRDTIGLLSPIWDIVPDKKRSESPN